MIADYLPIAILVLLSIAIAVIVIVLGHTFGPKRPTEAKGMAYESGMDPIGPGTRQMRLFGLIEMLVFIIILLVGYVYAWKKGALEWD